MDNPTFVLENDTHKLSWDFHMGSPNLSQKTRPYKRKKKKKNCKIVDFAVPADHRQNWKNVKRRTITSTLLENWKKIWNMKVTIIPFVIDAFGTVTKRLLKRLRTWELVETTQ